MPFDGPNYNGVQNAERSTKVGSIDEKFRENPRPKKETPEKVAGESVGLGSTANFSQYRKNAQKVKSRLAKDSPELARTVTGIKIITALAPLWWIFATLWVIQLLGAFISIFGFATLEAASAIPLIGSLLAEFSGGENLILAGIFISGTAGTIAYVGIIIVLTIRKVSFSSWDIFIVGVITWASHLAPFINILPLVAIWLGYIAINPKKSH